MKILHFILGKANPDRANGVNQVIYGLCKYMAVAGHEVRVIGLSTNMSKAYETVSRGYFDVLVYNKFFGKCFQDLKKQAQDVDIVHLHGVWQHYNIFFAKYLKSINKPYLVTIHSGLTEDRIKQSRYWFKLLYHSLFQKKIFNVADGLHAITREEVSDISKFTSNRNIFTVPNGVDLETLPAGEQKKESSGKINFGYLGRFGQEKNILGLVNAINQLPKSYLEKIQCHLIGPLGKEADVVRSEVKKLGIEGQICFQGGLYGQEKFNFLRGLDFYLHPSYSDVVSIAVMEAMALGLPCVVTRTSQVSYYYDSGAFLMVEPVVSDIRRGLMEMIDRRASWNEMSISAIKLVQETFNWKASAGKMLCEYQKIISS